MTRRASLGEDISKLVSKEEGEQLEIAFLKMMASDVAVDLNMLCVSMKDMIMSDANSTTTVTIKRNDSRL